MERTMTAKSQNDSVRVNTEIDEEEIGESPYFYSPYPERLVQVHEPGTRGRRDIVDLINKYWPATIGELEELSEDEFDEGYSGSHIRNVLRSHYIPEDILRTREENDEVDEERRETETPENATTIPDDVAQEEMPPEEEAWHRVFRLGIRVALENNITEDEAFDAFGSGFVEGQKLKDEME